MRIDIDRVSVSLGGARILHEVSAAIEPGEMVGLLGPNGSGKSSLLRTIWQSLAPSDGAVLLDGDDLAGLPVRQVARRVAVLLQDDGTDPRHSVREVVETGRLPHRRLLGGDDDPVDRVGEAMAAAGIDALAERRIGTLSGGQRQRALSARTLAQRTGTVLLDEPTNHLDLGAQHELLALFRNRPGTVIAALHDLNLAAAYCDRLLLLDQGRLVAAGTPDQVLTPARIGDVFGVAAALATNPLTGTPAVHLGPRPVTERTS